MNIAKIWLSILLLLSTFEASANTYYLDAEKGNDKNTGTTQETAWRTLRKINAQRLAPGDVVLFRRGQIFEGTLYLRHCGTATARIKFDAYGTGSLPKIGGLTRLDATHNTENTLEWTKIKENIWLLQMKKNGQFQPFADKSREVRRLWLRNIEQKPVLGRMCPGYVDTINANKGGWYSLEYMLRLINPQSSWFFYSKNAEKTEQKGLYVYSTTKPNLSDFFIDTTPTTDYFTESDVYAIYGNSVHHIDITNLALTGKAFNIVLQKCNNITIKTCEIGEKAGFQGIGLNDYTHDIDIQNCVIDSKTALIYDNNGTHKDRGLASAQGANHGIQLDDDVFNINIRNNTIKNWTHGCIIINATVAGKSIHDINIEYNVISNEDLAYGRAIGSITVLENAIYNINIKHNFFYKNTASTQLGGERVNFQYNIFYQCGAPRTSCHQSENGRDANYRASVFAVSGSYDAKGICRNNHFDDNLFYDCKTLAIQLDAGTNIDANNQNNISNNSINGNFFIYPQETNDTLKTLQIRTARNAKGELTTQNNSFVNNTIFYAGKTYSSFMVYTGKEQREAGVAQRRISKSKYKDSFLENFDLLNEKELQSLSLKIGKNKFDKNKITNKKPKIPFFNQLYNPENLPIAGIAK